MVPPRHGPTHWNEMTGRTLNERRAFAANQLYLGDHAVWGTPLVCPLSMFQRHALIYGPPGSGKTVLAAQLMTQLLAMGHDVIVIDCKGSVSLLNNALAEARRAADPRTGESLYEVRVFNASGRQASHIYNVCQQQVWREEPAQARAQTIMDAFGIHGVEGTDTAFFAAMTFLISMDVNEWFPALSSAAELLGVVNDRHLFAAKGGNPGDWNHSRHITANLRLMAANRGLNAIPSDPQCGIELTDVYRSRRPHLIYFFLSAIDDQRMANMVGRLVLEQLKKAALRNRNPARTRRTFVFCDEAQELFGMGTANALEQLREFDTSFLMFHQSRGQLVKQSLDLRERFENAIGAQICLGARTPEEIQYLQDTDRDGIEYAASWKQPQLQYGSRALLHPRYSSDVTPEGAPAIHVSESRAPRLDRASILKISADPQAGFIRGFLNEGTWAFDGGWVPFRWYHHVTRDEFREFSRAYPDALPGQMMPQASMPQRPDSNPSGFESAVTDVHEADLNDAIRRLAEEHRRRAEGGQDGEASA